MSNFDTAPSRRRSLSGRKLLSGLSLWLGLMLLAALIVHFAIVFALPTIGRAIVMDEIIPPDANAPRLYAGVGGELTPDFRFADGRMDSVYCSFDLADGAVRVGGSLDAPYWSLSVHTLSGLVVGSLNHNASTAGNLEVLIMRPALARDLAEAGAQLPSDALVVEMQDNLGVVRISALASFEAARPGLRRALADMNCSLATFTFVQPEAEEDNPTGPLVPSEPSGPPTVPQPSIPPNAPSLAVEPE